MVKKTTKTAGSSELTRAYKANPTIENYVSLRRGHPEEEIEVAISEALEWLFDNEDTLLQFGIVSDLVAAALDADQAAISELSLQLLELAIERKQEEKAGGTHLVSRKFVIGDELVNFLISLMLDALDWNNRLFIPRDLIVLIRYQIGGGRDADWERREAQEQSRFKVFVAICGLLTDGKPLTIRAVAKRIGVSATTVMRWYPEGTLAELLPELAELARTALEKEKGKR